MVSRGDYSKLDRWTIYDFFEAFEEFSREVEKAREKQIQNDQPDQS